MKGCGRAKENKVWIRALHWGIGLLLTSFLWFYSAIAAAGSLTASWTANTESDLAGYKVYYGTATKTYGAPIDVGKVVTTYTVTELTEQKTYYFAVTAYDTAGNQSGFSNEASGTVPDQTPPAAPTGMTVK
mgnify:CR=1 FL=1